MKNHSIYILILVSILCSCETAIKKYSLQELDHFSFRRNYFGADTLTGKALEEFMNRNPVANHIDAQKKEFFLQSFSKSKNYRQSHMEFGKV